MPYFSSNAEDFLGSLQTYVDKPPENGAQALSEVPIKLIEFADRDEQKIPEKAAQILATAVGKQKEWQTSFRKAGILTYAVERLELSLVTPTLAKQYLRVIGNCVADNDANRELVSEHFNSLVGCLEHQDLTAFALVVMFNLSNEYDPAHKEAAKLRLDMTIANYLVEDSIPEEALDYAVDLITWTVEQLSPAQVIDDTSLATLDKILNVALRFDEDRYFDYVAICVHYLQHPELQQKVANPSTFGRIVDLMLDFESRLDSEEIQEVLQALAKQSDSNQVSSEHTGVLLMVQLVNVVSATSATDAFVANFSLNSPTVQKLVPKLLEQSSCTVCACVMFGNLATSDEPTTDMVKERQLHLPLLELIMACKEPAILYAAAGFMRHLAFPENNRQILGDAGLVETCCYLLVNEDPSVRGEAAAILGKLVSNNLPNITKIITGIVPNDITVADFPDTRPSTQPTILYHIVTQALAPSAPVPSTSMKNASIELGRTIVTMLRQLGQLSTKDEIRSLTQKVVEIPLVARPVARLVRQRFFVDARSEGLLGLGLMTQTSEGAACVVKEMKVDPGLLEAVQEFASEQKEAKQGRSGLGRDYQNALVLLHGLAKIGANAMDESLRIQVDVAQSDLSKLLVDGSIQPASTT